MSSWHAKYKNDYGEYEITFTSKSFEKVKVVEKICQEIMDDRIQTLEDLDRVKIIQHYIKVSEQPKWISVEDKLPQPFVSVLVYMPEESHLPTVHEGYLAEDGKWYASFYAREPFEVTYWMPLPEPPEEET